MSVALAPPLIAMGPVGWAVLGVLTVVTAGAIILQATKKSDDDFADQPTSPEAECPNPPATPEQIADEGVPDPVRPVTGNGTRQVNKPGGMEAADRDFDRMGPKDVRTYENGTRVGTLPDGRTVNVRPNSSAGKPTVEISGGGGKPPTKIRYNP